MTQLAFLQGMSASTVLPYGIGAGALLIFFALVTFVTNRDAAAARIEAAAKTKIDRRDRGFLQSPTTAPKGLMKTLLPSDEAERTKLQKQLAQAGYSGRNALRDFTLIRAMLGFGLPSTLLVMIMLSRMPELQAPLPILIWLGSLTSMQVFQLLTITVAIGFFGPVRWLSSRVAERKQRIEEGFPNALDLMQISVESGLGFDAAMTRVGNELAEVSPDIAFEFLSVQRQVQAGRAREAALRDMADRTGVETVRAFANVVQQSMQFGTGMSEALITYAEELRETRELRAQEMANKLPVKMSAVLASLMLPALILLTVGPVLIRYIRFFGGD
jgi:tight adherence protein C